MRQSEIYAFFFDQKGLMGGLRLGGRSPRSISKRCLSLMGQLFVWGFIFRENILQKGEIR